jgi:hypothetical protein
MLWHATRPTLTGQLVGTSMEEMQLEIGVPLSFLLCSCKACGCLATCSWLDATWRFLSGSKIKVTDPFDKVQLACPEDSFLMVRFFARGYRRKELERLNNCRVHLRALLLSDLCTADGRLLTDDAMEVQPDPQRSSPFSWPRTHCWPKFQDQALWRSASCKALSRSTAPQVLVQPLSPFLPSTSATWLWNCSPSEQRLFVPTALSWAFCHVSAGRRQSLNRPCHHGGSVSSLPFDA